MKPVLKLFVGLLFLANLVGCAMTHAGQVCKSDQKQVVVSVNVNRDLSDKYYLFLEYTIENTTGTWQEFKFGNLKMGGADIGALTNDKLSAWVEGAELKLQKARYNTNLILGSMAAVGSAAAIGSNNKSTQKAGAAVAVGSVAAAGGVSASRGYQQVNSGMKGLNNTVYVPKTHILTPFKVAPESYVRRWIVVKNPLAGKSTKGVKRTSRGLYEYNLESKLLAKPEGQAAKMIDVSNTIRLMKQ